MAATSWDWSEVKYFSFGTVVHALYLTSVFDIYFTSPIVHGMAPYISPTTAPADRIVFFIADGLRADKFFEVSRSQTRAPYLRSVIEQVGCWGVSHTRVPTETRPGHVALIAGLYEDVAAVTKGWKENPVEFDSLFNESRYTWSWGSPDVLPMFEKGTSGNHIFTDMYEFAMIDFAGKEGAKLDEWVFNKVTSFLEKAKQDINLREKLMKDKIIFFLHLLGLDTIGHGYRPNSDKYLQNIGFVDSGIKKMVEAFENFYNHDSRTAYIMTSDHGMSNWGSHGGGHPSETLTPLVAWGAGIRGPIASKEESQYHDGLSEAWGLSHLARVDVEQADVAPLLSSLIGIPYPKNSVGILPTEYLNVSDHFKAVNLLTNAKQILVQYEIKQRHVKDSSLFFKQFALTPSLQADKLRIIQEKIKHSKFDEALTMSRDLIKLALQGFQYYHRHDRLYLSIVVTIGFLGWILSLVLHIIENYSGVTVKLSKLEEQRAQVFIFSPRIFKYVIGLISMLTVALLYWKRAPLPHYLYCLMPMPFWYELITQHVKIQRLIQMVKLNTSFFRLFVFFSIYAVSLIFLALSFFHREILSVILIGIGFYPLIAQRNMRKYSYLVYLWLMVTVILAIFPLLPTIGREENYAFVTFAAFFGATMGLIFTLSSTLSAKDNFIMTVLVASVVMATVIRLSTVISIRSTEGLPLINQIISWLMVPSVFIVSLQTSSNSISRLIAINIALFIVYILTCVSHEGIFFLVLTLTLAVWVTLESNLSASELTPSLQSPEVKDSIELHQKRESRTLGFDDVRKAFTFIYFIFLAFFGTGNIASINSFDPAAVNSFVTVFDPFTMGSILLLKVSIPFILVSCFFNLLQNVLKIPVRGLFRIVLVMTDFMAIVFFFLVKDEGSWLDIGTSISHFVIMLAFVLFLLPVFEIGHLLTGSVSYDQVKTHVQ